MGGMGPEATVDFMAKVVALTASGRDQDHVHMIVDQDPSVPNRRDAITGDGAEVTKRLAAPFCLPPTGRWNRSPSIAAPRISKTI